MQVVGRDRALPHCSLPTLSIPAVWAEGHKKVGQRQSRQACSKGGALGNPRQCFLQHPSALETTVPVKGTEVEKSHTKMNRDYVSTEKKRRFKDQHISEEIHALKLHLWNNSCIYFASSCSSKGIEQLRLRLRQPTTGWLLEKARWKKIHS